MQEIFQPPMEEIKPQPVKATLKDAIKALSEAVPNVLETFAELEKNSNVADLFSAYNQLRGATTALEALVSILNELKGTLSKKTLPDLLETLELDSVKSKGYTYSVGVRTNAHVTVENRKAANQWLTDNGYGALITPTVNSKTLSSAMSAYIIEKGEKPPEDLIQIHQEKYVSVRKANS